MKKNLRMRGEMSSRVKITFTADSLAYLSGGMKLEMWKETRWPIEV